MAGERLSPSGARLTAAAALVLLVTAHPAAATGGFWCDIDDASIAFAAQGGLSRSIPGGPFSFAAGIEIKMPDAPADFRELDLSKALVQSWIVGPDLRLQVYHEREGEPFASLELVLSAVQSEDEDDEWVYRGRYALTLAELRPGDTESTVTERTGEVSCGME